MMGSEEGPEVKLTDKEEFEALLGVIRDARSLAGRRAKEFESRRLGIVELTDKLEQGDTADKMVAAQLLGKSRDGAAVVALVDALEANRKSLLVAPEIVRVLKNIHTTEVVSGFFHRLFDDTDVMIQSECRFAISQRGHRAIERIEIEPHTAQFDAFITHQGVDKGKVVQEIKKIKEMSKVWHEKEAQRHRQERHPNQSHHSHGGQNQKHRR